MILENLLQAGRLYSRRDKNRTSSTSLHGALVSRASIRKRGVEVLRADRDDAASLTEGIRRVLLLLRCGFKRRERPSPRTVWEFLLGDYHFLQQRHAP